jgi:hypothetical protein
VAIYQEARRAKSLKMIAYSKGCEMATFALDPIRDDSGPYRFKCQKLGTVWLRGVVTGHPRPLERCCAGGIVDAGQVHIGISRLDSRKSLQVWHLPATLRIVIESSFRKLSRKPVLSFPNPVFDRVIATLPARGLVRMLTPILPLKPNPRARTEKLK